MPRKRKKRKVASQKKVTEEKITIDAPILEKLLENVELDDLLRLVKSWGYNAKETDDIETNIDLFNILNIKSLSKSQLADLWAFKILKNKIWKRYTISDPLPSRLGITSLNKRLKSAIKKEDLEKEYTPYVFKLDKHQFHIVLEFTDEPFLVETENAFSYQLIKPIARLSSVLDSAEKIVYIEVVDGKNSQFELFQRILQNALKTSFERIRVRPYEIKEIADKSLLKKAVFVCPREISGIEGVDRITLEGDDVAAGIKDIASRHEVNLEKVGAWAEILGMNDQFLLSFDGRIRKSFSLNKE